MSKEERLEVRLTEADHPEENGAWLDLGHAEVDQKRGKKPHTSECAWHIGPKVCGLTGCARKPSNFGFPWNSAFISHRLNSQPKGITQFLMGQPFLQRWTFPVHRSERLLSFSSIYFWIPRPAVEKLIGAFDILTYVFLIHRTNWTIQSTGRNMKEEHTTR